jgi:PAS domain S-box-containing protein
MLSILFKISHDAIVLTRVSDDEIIDCNQEFLNQIGYMREEVIGHTSLELNLYVDPREYLDYFNEINKNDIVTNFELKIKKKDASFISVLYSAWLININNEKILISKGHEITDLKQAEKKFNDSEVHYRQLFTSMNEMFQVIELIYDSNCNPTDYYYCEVNPAFEKSIGKSKEQLIDKCAKDIFGIVEDYWLELFDRVLKTGNPEQFENYSAELNKHVLANVWKLGENRVATLFTDFTERKMLEDDHKERNDKFKALFENSLDAVFLANPDGSILNANHAAEELFGYTEEELCKLGRDGIVDPKDPNLQDLLDINEKKNDVYGEHYFIKKDGTKFMAEISASVYKSKNGNNRSSIVIRDVTERRNAEKSLKRSHKKIDEILGSIKDSFYVLDHDYNFIYINQTAAHYFRYAGIENFIGRNFWEMFPKNLGTHIEENYRAAMNRREIRQFETQSIYSDIYFMVSVYPTQEGISILAKDVTEYKNAEKRLAEQAVMLANINDAVIGTDVNYLINYWSKSAEKMYGYTEDEIIGRYSEVLKPEFLGLTENEAREQLDNTGKLNVELIHTTKDGRRIIVDSANQTLYNDYGNPYGMIGINRDITERKNAEEQIKFSLEEKEILLKEIHHRVKNNLQIIASLLHLQESTVDSDVAAILKESEGRVRSMASIHENLYQSPTFNDINFKQYIEKLLYDRLYTYGIPKDTIRTKLDIKEINLNIETAIPLGLIINELVTNIVKYAFPHKNETITIKLKSQNEKLELIIADNGIGLPKDIDIENSETLGLQLVNNLINQLDGELEIDITNGTEFKILFEELKYKTRI